MKKDFSVLLLSYKWVFTKQFVMAGYFSFNEIKDIGSSTAVIAASENALFSKNTLDNQIKRLLLLTAWANH
jgi:hypothetical protein